jgi:hypothetical protein
MSKKKAIICTILFGIIVLTIATATLFIKNDEYGFTLFDIISPTICGLWCGECIIKFYDWLTK